MRIAVANQKGGTGKTWTSIGLAAVLGSTGHRVLVVDSDVNQGAGRAVTWHRRLFAAAAAVDPLTAYQPGGSSTASAGHRAVGFECVTMGELAQLRLSLDQFDDVIFDCPPGHPERITAAINLSDHVIVPIEPNAPEVEGVFVVRRLMAEHGQTTPLTVVLSRVNRARLAPRRMRKLLERAGFRVAIHGVPDRSEIAELYPDRHPRSSKAGWVAWEGIAEEITNKEATHV